jgi:Methionine biosynthesis protein MetW
MSPACPVASTGVSAPIPPSDDPPQGNTKKSDEERAAAALHEAFTRLQPQGSDAWNFLAAFTHLGDRYGPYQPGASGLSDLLGSPGSASARRPGRGRRRSGSERAGGEQEKSELEEAMAQVVEAFRFLSSRVSTLEQRLEHQDHPIDGPSWLVPAQELGAAWVSKVTALMVAAAPLGEVLHGDCGAGGLLHALDVQGVRAFGVEPRGGIALQALESGCAVTISEVLEFLERTPSDHFDGVVLSGVVDRLPLHALVPLLSQARRSLRSNAPLVVVATDPEDSAARRAPVAQDLVDGHPLHAQTWEILLARAGFVDVSPLPRDGDHDGRFALSAFTPA